MVDARLPTLVVIQMEKVKDNWQKIQSAKTGWFTSTDLGGAIQFFLSSLDEAIKNAELNLTGGVTKKDFVLQVASQVYDLVIYKSLPTWTVPFSPFIKSLVIDTIISKTIDFIVSKYNDGSWGKLS